MKLKKIWKNYWVYILAVLIPLGLMLLHCIIRNVWLFGEGSILFGDSGIQYIYIFEELWNKVHSGDFSFFSWNAIGGFDFYLNMLYYTISPSTIFVLISPLDWLENVIQLIIVGKWVLLSFSMVYFFMHTRLNRLNENKKFVSLVLGVCFILSNFILGVITLFNWMDTLILFPFLLLLVEQLVEKGKWKGYYICLSFAMIFNCYIAFPICIFILLWFILQLQMQEFLRKGIWKKFLFSSIGAFLTSFVILLPAVLNLSYRYTNNMEHIVLQYIKSICIKPADIIDKFFVFNTFITDGKGEYTFYISIGIIVLSLMYSNIKLNKKEKYIKILIIMLLLSSIIFGGLSYIWHAFSVPHGFSPRFGFLLLFMILIIVLDVVQYIEKMKIRKIIIMFIFTILLFMYAFFNIKEYNEPYVYLVTILLMVFDFILLFLFNVDSINKKMFIFIILGLSLSESMGNAYYQLSEYNVIKPEEHLCNKDLIEVTKDINFEHGTRAILSDGEANLGMKINVPTMSGFVSYANGYLGKTMYKIGMDTVQDAGLQYLGGSPLLNLIFNIKYGAGKYGTEFNECKMIKKGKNLNLYEMNQIAGLGYMVKYSVNDWTTNNQSPFQLQNQFVRYCLDKEIDIYKIFKPNKMRCITSMGEIELEKKIEKNVFLYRYPIMLPEDGNFLVFDAEKNMNLYFTLRISQPCTIILLIDDKIIYEGVNKTEQVILPIGDVEKGQTIKIGCIIEDKVGEEIIVAGQFAEWNEDVWQEAYKELSKNIYEIEEFQSDYVSGNIKADEDGIMMTSIPAMKGFKVWVDGKETKYEAIGDALIGVPLKKGKHFVEFRYRTPYAILGLIISGISISIFMIICIIGRRKNVSIFCGKGKTE